MDIVVIPYVLATVIAVMLQVLWEHAQMQIQIVLVIVMFVHQVIAWQIILFVQIQLPHVTVQAVAQCLIVSRAAIPILVTVAMRLVVVTHAEVWEF